MLHLQILHSNAHDENFLQNHQRNYKYFDYKMNFFSQIVFEVKNSLFVFEKF